MLRFFRQIRQRLLTDNKFSKYLLYAVGEILLVVIGILIALEVNNWNTEQSEQRLRNQYRQALLLDLKKDLETKKKGLEDFEGALEAHLRIVDDYRNPAVTRDSLYLLVKSFNPAFIRTPATNRNTFTALISSGNISLFDTATADAIISHYAASESFEADMDNQLNFYYQMFANYMTEIPFTAGVTKTGPLWELWDSVDMDKASILVTGYASLKSFNYGMSRDGLEDQIESTQNLIALLDKLKE